ncbi:MAG: glycosyltransferase family 2 protein [Anaerolineae bacterium]|nr:glycosyltransferase family 2 protein [Anaerolineae bacterium]
MEGVDSYKNTSNIPIAFVIYKRPDVTRRVFAAIAAARPRRLYVIADGPRDESEAARCAETRAIIEGVNWPCEVFTDYAETNLGLKRRNSSGMDWVFAHEERAIILEDDNLSDPTFFRYCADLLDHYRDDERIMQIAGTNPLRGAYRPQASYFFTGYMHTWGWATWRRAWQHFDVTMSQWADPQVREHVLSQFSNLRERDFWFHQWSQCYEGKIDSWSFGWSFACRARDGLSVMPRHNLISNIGFGLEATHTLVRNRVAAMPTQPMTFPLRHPTTVMRDVEADRLLSRVALLRPPLYRRAVNRLRRYWRRARRMVRSSGSISQR